jgi:type II secretory ATPase GspE/PulE/Tfp pilus assembly ATPase PilB-like protein
VAVAPAPQVVAPSPPAAAPQSSAPVASAAAPVAATTAPDQATAPSKNSNSITGDWPAFTPETKMSQHAAAEETEDEEPIADEMTEEPDEGDQSITSNLRQLEQPDAHAHSQSSHEYDGGRALTATESPPREPEYFDEEDLAKRAQEEAIVLLANQILGGAIKRHCSNIHLIAGEKQAAVQYRLNGSLFTDRKLPQAILTALVARYKMMARLNLAEQRMPQDGHIKVKSSSKEIVCLLSTVPNQFGENVVIWIL